MEYRAAIGGALIGVCALAWVSAAVAVATAKDQNFSSPIILTLLGAGGACLIIAFFVFGAHRPIVAASRRIARRSPIVIVRRGKFHQELDASVAMGEYAQYANPRRPSAIALGRMSKQDQRAKVDELFVIHGNLRTAETNFRARPDRGKAATPGGHIRINTWLDDLEELLDAHFPSQAYRVRDLGRLSPDATAQQALEVLDQAVKPLHNFKRQLGA